MTEGSDVGTDGIWSYRPGSGHREGLDLTGFRVEATDGIIGHVDRQADDLGEIPQVVLEERAASGIGQAEASLPADVGAGEDGGPSVEGVGNGGGHAVLSSGRRGSSSSRSATSAVAAARTAGSKRSRICWIRVA